MKRILLLLADGFELLEAAAFTDVFGWADIDGEEKIELLSVGLRSPLKCTFGFSAIPDKVLSEVDLTEFDALAIPGGFDGAGFYGDAYSVEFSDVIQFFESQNKPIASVCVASLALGHAGVLKNRRATVYHQAGGKRKEQLEAFGAHFIDKAVVCDGGMISSTGPGTGVEVALQLLSDLTSEKNTQHIRELMRLPEPTQEWLNQKQVA